VRRAYKELIKQEENQFAHAVFFLLAFAVDKQADYSSSLCRWVSGGGFIAGTLAGEKKLPMISDFAESNPVGPASGSWGSQIDWITRFISREAHCKLDPGTVCQSSADDKVLPADSADALITDPPYYDSVPYADLSDYFYVWLKRTFAGIEELPHGDLTPKERQMTVDHPDSETERARYESLLTGAFTCAGETISKQGIGVIVFAHKSTSGWEALLEAIIRSGWVVKASWPIDTERAVRLNAIGTASLASSVHIICRPRENPDGSIRTVEVGDWRDVLAELPRRIHDWMPRLAEEGVVGADGIFACLGPALEIFSRYSRVEKASGESVTLKEYLEHVWAAVAKEALTMIFAGADATGFEEDARLTAMWLWTLKTGEADGNGATSGEEPEEDEEGSGGKGKPSGFSLEYDAARKIAQGLGAHLEALTGVVEVKGETARLLPVAERTRILFGNTEADAPTAKRKKKDTQLKLGFAADLEQAEEAGGWGQKGAPRQGNTVLDRIHQAMILFAAGRGEALKRFLVEEGVGRDDRFWRLAQALSALYPSSSDEKRWVDGVLARTKGLGF
jgi:putative DNA methylase